MEFKNETELTESARLLEGMRLSEISDLMGDLDVLHRKHTKGNAAKVIETGYFQIPANSSEEPDFKNLGIELKVSPLRYVNRANVYTTKERNVIKMVDYNEIAETPDWTHTKLQNKLGRVLFVLYVHDNSVDAWEWKIAKTFLWSPTTEQARLIQRDYEIMRKKILSGEHLREGDHTFLATCPKHSGGFLKETPLESPRRTLAEHPTMTLAEKRGYCIKREAFIALIAEAIEAPLVKSGRSIGISSDYMGV